MNKYTIQKGMNIMMDPQTAYYFKKFYRNIIKWWFVDYNPDVKKIWPSKAEEEAARLKEEEELLLLEETQTASMEDAYNETTGSYSGLYGQGPMDDDTQYMLDQIMTQNNKQGSIDSMLKNSSDYSSVYSSEYSDVILPPEQNEIIQEANAIYERLLREAQEDEDRKSAEIEAIKRSLEADS